MRCPKCNYISFDYLENCKKCGTDLSGIRAELCYLEVPPMEVSIWDWLKERTDDTVSELPSGETGALSGLEIPLEDQTEEIIIDESIIAEFEEEKPSTTIDKEFPDEVVSPDVMKEEITLELSEAVIEKKAEEKIEAELTARSDKVEVEELSFEELEIPIEKTSIPEISISETEKESRKPAEKEIQEDSESIDSLLKELDEILEDES